MRYLLKFGRRCHTVGEFIYGQLIRRRSAIGLLKAEMKVARHPDLDVVTVEIRDEGGRDLSAVLIFDTCAGDDIRRGELFGGID